MAERRIPCLLPVGELRGGERGEIAFRRGEDDGRRAVVRLDDGVARELGASRASGDLREQLEKVLKALPPTGRMPVAKGRRLMKKDGVEVRLNAKGSLEIGVKIDLRENADYIKKILRDYDGD